MEGSINNSSINYHVTVLEVKVFSHSTKIVQEEEKKYSGKAAVFTSWSVPGLCSPLLGS